MKAKEALEKTAENMKRWQKIENAAVRQTAAVMEESSHPLIRMVMEIIHNDSQMHYRVQQLIVDSIEKEQINVFYDELGQIWDAIEKHIAIEKKTIELAKECIAALEGTKFPVQQYLLNYLKTDEDKHDMLLADLARIKNKMYP